MDARSARRAGMAQSQTCIVQIAVVSVVRVIFAPKAPSLPESKCDDPKYFCPFGTPKLSTTADGYYAVDANSIPDPRIA